MIGIDYLWFCNTHNRVRDYHNTDKPQAKKVEDS